MFTTFRHSLATRLAGLVLAGGLTACGGGSGGDSANSGNSSTSVIALTPESVDSGWSPQHAATRSLLPVSLAGTYLKGTGWALATRTDAAAVTSYSASFAGRGWYVDPDSGDDSGPGTQARPWRTLQRAASGPYAAGDALLLRCGKTFRETLDMTNAAATGGNLLIAGYGDCTGGSRPVISGSDLVASTGWSKVSQASDQVMAHALATAPRRVFFNGQPLRLARHPNAQGVGQEFSLLRADGANRNRFFLSAADTSALAAQDLIGATVYVRVAPYEIEKAVVTAHQSGTGLVTLDRSLDHAIIDDAGYILEGKAWMLDAPGEWVHDSGSSTLRVWGPNSESAGAFTRVEVTTRDRGLRLRWITDATVAWLQTEQHADIGQQFVETHGLRLNSVASRFDQEYGLQVHDANNVRIEDANVVAAGWVGIAVREGSQVTVQRNLVTDIGLYDRPGSTDASISVLASAASVNDNVVYRSAHHGLRLRNVAGNEVRDNLVVASCVRLTDCAGIYTFTAAYPTLPAVGYTQAATISGNVVIGSRSNREGLWASVGKNMATGIFLDELTSGANVSGNLIADTEIGIHLHDAAFNVISGNQVRAASYAAIRGMASRTDVDALKGNQVVDNSLGHFSSITELPGGISTDRSMAFVQFWYHPNDVQGLFQGVTPNVSARNETVGTIAQSEVRWRLVQSGTEWVLEPAQWQAIAPQDTHVAPVLHRRYRAITAGSSLISNGAFQSGATSWGPYLNSMGSGGAFLAGSLADCGVGQTCGSWTPGMSGDYLASAPFTMSSTSGDNLYLLQFSVTGGQGGGNARATIRRRVSPWEGYGLSIPSTPVAQGSTLTVERFFRASGGTDAVLDFKGQVGGQSLLRDVTLQKVSAVELPDAPNLAGHLYNPRSTTATFTCAMLALSSCDVVNSSGQAVAWPINLSPGTSMSLYTRDSRWLRP